MSESGAADLSLTQHDAKQLQSAYKTLSALQRKTLTFLIALNEYEQKRQRPGDVRFSRMAFIVTPLMVNHYNHMHHVYRASMYGKVPDLCEQTGGILCTDLGALREELVDSSTPNSNNLYSTVNLPYVKFDFKAQRDGVVATAVRMLDSIDIKQPDLTHSIRDDYIQNVRAIQESLTDALEKSRGRSVELKSRLDETSKKLKAAERILATAPDEAKEIFKLKEEVGKLKQLLLTQRVEFDSNTLQLRESESECNLLRELMKRINDNTKEEAEGLATLRAEILAYTERELAKMKEDFRNVRDDLGDHVKSVITRSNEEKNEAVDLCRSMMMSSRSDRGKVDDRLQRDYDELHKVNAQLNRQLVTAESKLAECQENYDELLHKVNAELKQELATAKSQVHGCQQNCDRMQSENAELKQQLATAENKNEEYKSRVAGYELGLAESKQRQHSTNIYDTEERMDYDIGVTPPIPSAFAAANERQQNRAVLADLDSLFKFFADPNNVEIALQLAKYIYENGVQFYSGYGDLLTYLETVITNDRVKMYVNELNRNRAMGVIRDSGLIEEINANRSDIENINRTLNYSDHVINDLLTNVDAAYGEIGPMLQLEVFPRTIVGPESLNDYFLRRFGKPLKDRLMLLANKLVSFKESIDVRDKTISELRADLESTKKESVELTDFQLFAADPARFDKLLQNVWHRPDADPLKKLLNAAYYALALDRVTRYETSNKFADELKLYNLVEYTVLTNHIKRVVKKRDSRPELVNPKLDQDGYFLHYFISQIGNVQVENYVNKLDLRTRNRLALILFEDYYIPVVNKSSFVTSIEGPFANFNMVYKI